MALSEAWKNTVKDAITNPKWDEYDAIIKKEVRYYKTTLENPPCHIRWPLIKAMLWVESGGPRNPAWRTRPMQIGHSLDPGWDVLLAGSKNDFSVDPETRFARSIMSTTLKENILNNFKNNPRINVQAGIAYIVVRLAVLKYKSTKSGLDPKAYTVTVNPGDNASKLATRLNTTIEQLKLDNPHKNIAKIYPGDILTYHKASMTIRAIQWMSFNSSTLANRYNTVGDASYFEKLEYINNYIFPHLKPESRITAHKVIQC